MNPSDAHHIASTMKSGGIPRTHGLEVMKKRSLERVLDALNRHEVRYLIAGGLAVVAHGYPRFTSDVDLILDMTW
jgi:hypothetical protein